MRSPMSTSASQIDGHASLRRVAEVLTAADVGALVVIEGERTLGVVSERDVVRTLAEGGDPDAVRAADVVYRQTVRTILSHPLFRGWADRSVHPVPDI